MIQLNWKPFKKARRTDPVTSHEAAESLDPVKVTETQTNLLKIVDLHGPLSDEQIREVWEWSGFPTKSASGLRTRRKELEADGLIECTGDTAVLTSGRRGLTWRITEAGRDAVGVHLPPCH